MIGIIPAGGKATRIHGIPKYLLPTPQGTLLDVLVERMQRANMRKIVIMSKGINTSLLFHAVLPEVMIADRDDRSMSHAVMLAREYAEPDEACIFGMSDTYWELNSAYSRLILSLSDGADVAVGVFQTRPGQHRKLGMCRMSRDNIVEVVDKPDETDLQWAWGILAWKPSFWEHMRETDPHIGFALPRAIEAGLDVRAEPIPGQFWDCGTPDEYFECIRSITGQGEPA